MAPPAPLQPLSETPKSHFRACGRKIDLGRCLSGLSPHMAGHMGGRRGFRKAWRSLSCVPTTSPGQSVRRSVRAGQTWLKKLRNRRPSPTWRRRTAAGPSVTRETPISISAARSRSWDAHTASFTGGYHSSHRGRAMTKPRRSSRGCALLSAEKDDALPRHFVERAEPGFRCKFREPRRFRNACNNRAKLVMS